MSDDFFSEIQDGFLQEALDLLTRVEALSLQLEKDPRSQETFAELARLAHNFKGSGKAVGFEHISSLGHRIEDFILAIKKEVIPPSPSNLDFLFKCLDRLRSDIELLVEDKTRALDHSELFAELDSRLGSSSEPPLTEAPLTEPSVTEAPLTEPLADALAFPKEFRQAFAPPAQPELEAVEKTEVAQAPTAIDESPGAVANHEVSRPASKDQEAASAANLTKPLSSEVLRIQKSKIDFLLECFGEQVILQSTLEQCKFDLEANRELVLKTISQLTKLTFELQSHALSLTMVQLGPVFTKLERAIRDAARMCEKSVEVRMIGSEVEVDKTLIDSLSDSLTHMVRNAVDHALEPAIIRREIGKPEQGTVEVAARRVGGQLWIEVTDDGKGLNPEVIRDKAVAKGLISKASAEKLSRDESLRLIFANGFSTKEVVSEVSGRGVGMNVVEESVTALNGQIEILSEVGKGTTFRLKLPLSLAIFNGAIVGVNGQKFVVPSSEIAEIGRIDVATQLELGQDLSAIRIREEVFRLIDLRRRLPQTVAPVANSRLSRQRELPILITRKMGNRAFLVDEVLGMQKIVQKPLGDEVKSRPEFAAGTILGDGSPGVILNLHHLAEGA